MSAQRWAERTSRWRWIACSSCPTRHSKSPDSRTRSRCRRWTPRLSCWSTGSAPPWWPPTRWPTPPASCATSWILSAGMDRRSRSTCGGGISSKRVGLLLALIQWYQWLNLEDCRNKSIWNWICHQMVTTKWFWKDIKGRPHNLKVILVIYNQIITIISNALNLIKKLKF